MSGWYGVDYGSYTRPETIDFARMREFGVQTHMIGLTGNPYFTTQLRNCVAEKVPEILTYLIPGSWNEDGEHRALWALDMMKAFKEHVHEVCLDIETLYYEAIPDWMVVDRWMQSVRDPLQKAGYEVSVYSNQRMWGLLTRGKIDWKWKGVKRTDAYYDNDPWAGYSGPWIDDGPPARDQYAGSANLYGANVDLLWCEGGRTMTDDEIKGLVGALLGREIATITDLEASKKEALRRDYLLTHNPTEATKVIDFETSAAGWAEEFAKA